MPKREARGTVWAEERLCKDWESGFDPDHPALVEATAFERRNAQIFEDARRRTGQAQAALNSHKDQNPASDD